MKIAIVVGSHRRESGSARVARYLEQELKKLGISETYLLSLSGNPLPLWDEDVWSGDEKWKSLWGPISKELKSSDGLVVMAIHGRQISPLEKSHDSRRCPAVSTRLTINRKSLLGLTTMPTTGSTSG